MTRAQRHLSVLGVALLSGAGVGVTKGPGLGLVLSVVLAVVLSALVEGQWEKEILSARRELRELTSQIYEAHDAGEHGLVARLNESACSIATRFGLEIPYGVRALVANLADLEVAKELAKQRVAAEVQRAEVKELQAKEAAARVRRAQEEARQEEERALRRRLEAEQDRQRLARLKGFACRISGGCWVSRESGSSDVIRGMRISFFPWSDRVLTSFRAFYPKVRFHGDVSDAAAELEKSVVGTATATAETNVDGKFRSPVLGGGRYIVYARWRSADSEMCWVIPLEVDCDGERELNLHNRNATDVFNS